MIAATFITSAQKEIIVAFKSYHAIRLSHRELVDKAIQCNIFDAIHELLIAYARTHASEFLHRHESAS